MIIPISNEEFSNKVQIKFNNILDGFDNFKNFTLEFNNEDDFISYIENIFLDNNSECYFDFYINKLTEKEIDNIINLYKEDDKKTLLELIDLAKAHRKVYFKLKSKELIPLLTRLSTREIFFITFYFTKRPITIWGNYNMKFPYFTLNNEDLNYYAP